MEKLRFSSVRNQFFAVACANISAIAVGCISGWNSPALRILKSNESPLSTGPISVDELSWIGSIENLGLIMGYFVFAAIANYFGRKIAILLLAFPQIIGWLFVIYGNDVTSILLFRVIASLSTGGMLLCLPLMVAEISEDCIRGILGSAMTEFAYVGILFALVSGAYLDYHLVPKIMIFVPILFLCLFVFVPETPQYLWMKNNKFAAEKSLRFYKNCSKSISDTDQRFDAEMEKLTLIVQQRRAERSSISPKDFLAPQARHGLFIGLCINFFNVFSGNITFTSYASIIFQESGSNLNPNESAIVMVLIQVIGSLIAIVLIDKVGRRFLLILSSIGCSIGLMTMGAYTYLSKIDVDVSVVNWIPLASLAFISLAAAIGMNPLRILVMVEILPTKLRSFGSVMCLCFFTSMIFGATKAFPVMSSLFGMHIVMWVMSAVSLVGTLFYAFVLEETKGTNINAK